jgi:hypothetical protein
MHKASLLIKAGENLKYKNAKILSGHPFFNKIFSSLFQFIRNKFYAHIQRISEYY